MYSLWTLATTFTQMPSKCKKKYGGIGNDWCVDFRKKHLNLYKHIWVHVTSFLDHPSNLSNLMSKKQHKNLCYFTLYFAAVYEEENIIDVLLRVTLDTLGKLQIIAS